MGEPMMRILSVRYHPEEMERWKEAAELSGMAVAELARKLLLEYAADILDCKHINRREYPWSSVCLDCGLRLK